MCGLRSAGSIFKNPQGESAGRLMEEAGLKGRMVGAAAISSEHANIVTTTQGATASDVRALIEIAGREVALKHKVELEREIVFLE